MTPEQQKELNEHLKAIAKILYAEAPPDSVQNLEGIEETIRAQTLQGASHFCQNKCTA